MCGRITAARAPIRNRHVSPSDSESTGAPCRPRRDLRNPRGRPSVEIHQARFRKMDRTTGRARPPAERSGIGGHGAPVSGWCLDSDSRARPRPSRAGRNWSCAPRAAVRFWASWACRGARPVSRRAAPLAIPPARAGRNSPGRLAGRCHPPRYRERSRSVHQGCRLGHLRGLFQRSFWHSFWGLGGRLGRGPESRFSPLQIVTGPD